MLRHKGSGAVTAAIGHHEREPEEPRHLLDQIAPVKRALPPGPRPQVRSRYPVEENVRRQVARLSLVADIATAIKKGETRFVGDVYDLRNGRVRKSSARLGRGPPHPRSSPFGTRMFGFAETRGDRGWPAFCSFLSDAHAVLLVCDCSRNRFALQL